MANYPSLAKRVGLALPGVALLAISYLYQYTDVLALLAGKTYRAEYHFIANRVFRILLNDIGMVMIIYAIFIDYGVIKLAFFVQLIDLIILLPIYLSLKLPAEGVSELSSPLLSQFHRLVVNPILLILLIPAIFYQRAIKK
jgi:exosortase F-associated protein